MVEAGGDERAKGEHALKVFLESQSKVATSTEKSAKASEVLSKKIGDNDQGLVAAISDLIDEIQDLREVIHILAEAIVKSGGINLDIGSILGRKRP